MNINSNYSQFYRGAEQIRSYGVNAGSALNGLKYMTNWYAKAVKTNPNMVDEYRKQLEE